MNIEVYTDGSATTNDKPGGYGWVMVQDKVKLSEGSGHMEKASNNDAELEAAIQGLKAAVERINTLRQLWAYSGGSDETQPKISLTLVSDSQLILGWADGTYAFRQHDKIEKYKELQLLVKNYNVKTRWVKGHDGDEHNERCDKLANAARLQFSAEPKITEKKARKTKIWTEQEDEFLLANYQSMIAQEIADVLGRTKNSVVMRLYEKEIRKTKEFIPITAGERFGKLSVLSLNEIFCGSHSQYNCRCDCGNYISVRGDGLRAGQIKSCGCSRVKLSQGELTINHVFLAYRANADKRSLSFELTKLEFIALTEQNCHYCDAPPREINALSSRANVTKNTIERSGVRINGIDRKNSNLGYTIENCVPCCSTCNYMKRDLNYDAFFDKISEIYNKRNLR